MRLIQLAPAELDLNGDHFRADFGSWPGDGIKSDDKSGKSRHGSLLDAVTEPLVAIDRPNSLPVLVSGFRKFHALTASGKGSVPVLIVSPESILAHSNLTTIMTGTQMNLPLWLQAGWLLALHKLSPVDHSPLEIAGMLGRASNALAIPLRQAAAFCPASESCEAVLSAATLPSALLKRLQRWKVDANKAALLARYSRPERPLAVLLTCRVFQLSISRMRRFEELVRDIALRQHQTLHQVLKGIKQKLKPPVTSGSGQIERPDTELFFRNLERIRSPERSAKMNQFDAALATLRLDHGMTINPPPDFEGDTIEVLLRIRAETDPARYASALAANPEAWRQLLDVLRTEDDTIQRNSD